MPAGGEVDGAVDRVEPQLFASDDGVGGPDLLVGREHAGLDRLVPHARVDAGREVDRAAGALGDVVHLAEEGVQVVGDADRADAGVGVDARHFARRPDVLAVVEDLLELRQPADDDRLGFRGGVAVGAVDHDAERLAECRVRELVPRHCGLTRVLLRPLRATRDGKRR